MENKKTNKSKNKKNNNTNKNIRNKRIIKKEERISKSFNIMILLIFAIFFIYGIGVFVHNANKPKIESMVLKSDDVSKNSLFKGLVVRSEDVYKSDKSGYLNYDVIENNKIKKADLLYEISNQQEVTNLTGDLNNINEDLYSLQTFRHEYSMYKNEIDTIENNTIKYINDWNMGSYSDLYKLSKNINDNINLRNQIVFSDQRVVDNSKIDTRDTIQNKIDTNVEKIYASNGGLVSYSTDGLESAFTTANMDTLTKEQTNMDKDSKKNIASQVTVGENVIRIINSNIWYICSYLPSGNVTNYKVNDFRNIFINRDDNLKEISVQVHSIKKVGDDSYVIFQVKDNILDYINDRSLQFALKSITYHNLKIPKKAIITKEMLKIPVRFIEKTDKSVVLKQGEKGVTSVTPIVIYSYDSTNQYAYLDKENNDLLIGDILCTSGTNGETYQIGDYVKMSGVYKINNGTVEYTKINVNANITDNNEYTYAVQSGDLKEYDRIVVNASAVTEGQIVE